MRERQVGGAGECGALGLPSLHLSSAPQAPYARSLSNTDPTLSLSHEILFSVSPPELNGTAESDKGARDPYPHPAEGGRGRRRTAWGGGALAVQTKQPAGRPLASRSSGRKQPPPACHIMVLQSLGVAFLNLDPWPLGKGVWIYGGSWPTAESTAVRFDSN